MADPSAPPAEECKCEKGAPKWVVTFGDMMSLLLTFFVLLLSFSTTDVVKYKKMVGSVKEAFGVATVSPADTVPMGKRIMIKPIELPTTFAALVAVRAKATNAAKSSSSLELESGADWVRIKVEGDALFDSGSWTVKPEAGVILDEVGELILQFKGTVAIEGHTDGEPPTDTVFEPGSYLGDYELAAMRAISVLRYFVENQNVPMEKMVPTTLGTVRPREFNEIEQGRARNRRVEFEFRTGEVGDRDAEGNAKSPTRELGGEIIK